MIAPPRNDQELHQLCLEHLDIDIPTVSPSPGTDAPLMVLSDLYFKQVPRGLLVGARGSGKTWLLSILNLLVSLFRPGTKTRTAGAVLGHSDVLHGQLRKYCRMPGLRELVVDNYEDRIIFRNSSQVVVTSGGADSSVLSEHASRLCIDEADEWDEDRYENFVLNLTGAPGYPVQIVCATADYSDSGLLGRIQKSGAFVRYDFDSFTSLLPCGSCIGESCGFYVQKNAKGLLEPLCQGRGLLARGYNPVAAASIVREEVSKERWDRQQMLKASGAGNLWPMFDEKRHVAEPPPIPATVPRVAGVDWAVPTIVLLAKDSDGVWWATEEFGGKYATLELLTEKAAELAEQYGDLLFLCGAHDTLNVLLLPEWAERGINLLPMQGKMVRREFRHAEITRMLKDGLLKFSPDCPLTIHQVKTATYRDEEGRRRKPDDFRDALSYGVAGISETGGLGGLPGGGLVL